MNQTNEYSEYRTWKNWTELFKPSHSECLLFEKEFDGIALKKARLLDIGFGSGSLLAWARQKGAEVEGMEILEELVAAAREQDIPTWQSLDDPPNDAFDVITLFDVCEHIPRNDLEKTFRKLSRILVPGGTLIVRVPNCQSPFGWVNQLGDHTHISQLSGPILKRAGEQVGLSCIKVSDALDERTLSYTPKALIRRLLQALTLALIRYSWGSKRTPSAANVIVVFTKNQRAESRLSVDV